MFLLSSNESKSEVINKDVTNWMENILKQWTRVCKMKDDIMFDGKANLPI